ncbi:hypothetical protein SDC9_175092 [bioreactor metagenome]|uniref:Uncharacterized protein n=1 Tax=bioreactor metagenome TaxID=1076179 RepID=A0A645GL56_9ZZZZ
MAEVIVAENRRTQRSGSDQRADDRMLPAEIFLDITDEFIDFITDPALTRNSGQRDILAHHDELDIHIFGQLGGGDMRFAFQTHAQKLMQVGRHAADGRRVLNFQTPHETNLVQVKINSLEIKIHRQAGIVKFLFSDRAFSAVSRP